MTNYKPSHREFNIGGLSKPIPDGATVKILHDVVNLSTVVDGFINLANNSIYQVASGKTFYMVGIRVEIGAALTGNVTIYQADTENATTLSMITILLSTAASGTYEIFFNTDGQNHGLAFVSGKFITYNPSVANIEYIQAIGYEL